MKNKREFARQWLLKAASDLKIARREMAEADPATDAVCFHFQQAVEKMLKAWLTLCLEKVEQTHNIEVLLRACERTDPSFNQLRPAEALTPYAVDVRYADDFYFPSRAEMERAGEIAATVEAFVSESLVAEGVDLNSQE